MSATDELRRLLDERGVEWDYGIGGETTTEFVTSSGLALSFMDWRDRLTCTTLLIPEQVIEATLGRGTCRRVSGNRSYRTQGGYRIECSECGYGLADKRYRYCPNCGRKVVG